MPSRRAAAVLTSAAALAVISAPPAFAINPPSVPPGAGAPHGPTAPTDATEQKLFCAEPIPPTSAQLANPPAAQQMLHLSQLWKISRGSGQRVAVIDTGVVPSGRLPRLVAGGDFVASGSGLSDCDSHGTMVAGIIAAQPSDSDGIAGVAPDSTIISIRQSSVSFSAKNSNNSDAVVGDSGYGNVTTLAYAVTHAVEQHATVINISEAACVAAGSNFNDKQLGAALQNAHDRGVPVIAAAGNVSDNCPQNPAPNPQSATDLGWQTVNSIASPAWYSQYVLSVGTVDSTTGAPDGSSLHGPWVGVAAPGTNIVGLGAKHGDTPVLAAALPGDKGPVPFTGSSFASAYVTGVVADMRAAHPDWSVDQIFDRIKRTAHGAGNGHDVAVGFGVIDPIAAMTAQLSDSPLPDPGAGHRIQGEAPATDPDRVPKMVALIGLGVLAAGALVVWAVSIPVRRTRRLEEDEDY